MVYIEIERVERERESFANCAWDNLLYKKKKRNGRERKRKRVVVEKIRISRRLKLVLR